MLALLHREDGLARALITTNLFDLQPQGFIHQAQHKEGSRPRTGMAGNSLFGPHVGPVFYTGIGTQHENEMGYGWQL